MPRVRFARVARPALQISLSNPRPPAFNPDEENAFRAQIEQAFEKLVIPAASGGAGGDTTAKYLLDTAATDLTNGIVIHRALGPDRVPASPNAMDDEMTDATHGYNPALWSVFSTGAETYHLDPNGGLRVDMASDNKVEGIYQPFSFSGNWAFVTKVCLSSDDAAANSFAGLFIQDGATGRIQWYSIGKASGVFYWSLDFSNGNTFVATEANSSLGHPEYHSYEWHYLRVSNGVSSIKWEVSNNGVAWHTIMAGAGSPYVNNPSKIGIFTYQQNDPGSAYFQFFRRTV